MSFNYPEFLPVGNNQNNHRQGDMKASQRGDQNQNVPDNVPISLGDEFNSSLLFKKLTNLETDENSDSKSPTSGPTNDFMMPSIYANKDSFNLPIELQGGIGTISSRRPSYAAESFTRSNFPPLFNNNLMGSQLPQFNATSASSAYFNNSNNPNPNNHPMTAPGNQNVSKNLSSYAMMNNYNQNFNFDQFNDSFANNFSLNSNFNDFQARRPSQLVDFQQPQQAMQQQFLPTPLSIGNSQSFVPAHLQQQQQQQHQQHQQQQPQQPQQPQQQDLMQHQLGGQSHQQPPQGQSSGPAYNQSIKLENGLILKDQYIIASPDLKNLYLKTIKYFQDPKVTTEILNKLNNLLLNPIIIKLITFIKNLNNLTFNHKILCLVINKNGKFDLLSYPNNSNIFLQKDDLVIVDGDRGKDLVMIVEPLVNLNFAVLFNFLKKLEHLKSLTIHDAHSNGSNNHKTNSTHSTLLNASTIINSHSNEDNEFIITLPTKQVLRFATPKEIHKTSGKFLEEKKAFITCYNKIKELNLQKSITLINVEYQSDFKKLIFYYFANFKRIDFRGLIKELFKIYKTRIWLCAVLPYDKPEMYITKKDVSKESADHRGNEDTKPDDAKKETKESLEKHSQTSSIPFEYELTNDQILNFSINEFENLASPTYFHSINLLNLIQHLNNEINSHFYGFNNGNTGGASTFSGNVNLSNSSFSAQASAPGGRSKIVPSFNPFGDSN